MSATTTQRGSLAVSATDLFNRPLKTNSVTPNADVIDEVSPLKEDMSATQDEEEPLPDLYQGKKSRANRCCCNVLLFTWVTPIVNFTKKYGKLEVDFYGELNDEDRVEIALKKLENAWEAKQQYHK